LIGVVELGCRGIELRLHVGQQRFQRLLVAGQRVNLALQIGDLRVERVELLMLAMALGCHGSNGSRQCDAFASRSAVRRRGFDRPGLGVAGFIVSR
jgi:hypothetical protein